MNLDDDGNYNCALDARRLFAAIREMNSKRIQTDKKKIVQVLKGGYSTYRHLASFGAGKFQKPYYWEAFIDQMLSADYIEFLPGQAGMAISREAQEWLKKPSSEPLRVKAIGAIYSYLKRKSSTPISNIQWNHKYTPNVTYTYYG